MIAYDTNVTDAELVRRALSNPDDYALIVRQYERLIMRYAQKISRLSPEDAEDIAQQVFLKAYRNLNDFDLTLKLANWLLRIAHNEVIDFWRRQQRRPQTEELAAETVDTREMLTVDFGNDFDRAIKTEAVQRILDLLQPDFREVLYLHYFEDKTYDEIADILKRPPGTVAALISRAKKTFAGLAARTGRFSPLASAS